MSNSLQPHKLACSPPAFSILHCLPEFAQTHLNWVSDAIQLSHPLLPPSPLALNLSQLQGLFQWVSWPKYWSLSLSISLSNEYSRLISFKIDWFDLLAVQATLKSLLWHHSLKASVLRCSAFFMVQSHIHTWLLEKPWLWLYGPLSTNLLPGPYILSLYQEGYVTGQVSKSQVPRYKCQLRQKSRHI